MRISKGKRNRVNRGRTKTQIKRDKVNCRSGNKERKWFLTMRDMAEFKHDEAVNRAAAKRSGEKPIGVRQTVCRCGVEGCSYTTILEDSGASLPKQKKGTPTKHPKRKTHPMFRGKIVE